MGASGTYLVGTVPSTIVVVPCFNEAARLRPAAFAPLTRAGVRVLFVDDGSTDGTAQLLAAHVRDNQACAEMLTLPCNCGKGEAVRQGLLRALASGAEVVGFLDADLATPPSELLRILDAMTERKANVALGSRVALLGSSIHRYWLRHYLGRVFATGASLALGVPVYDTQCGGKLFRATPVLRRALSTPFRSRWAFDVELLGRLLGDGTARSEAPAFIEVPLHRWTDVKGSKMDLLAMARTGLELVTIALRLRATRARRTQPHD